MGWPDVGEKVALEVSNGRANQGILFCWTGTGVSIAANKVPGIRAALCWDAETAKGARLWDDANVLAMSLRSTSPALAREILDAWFSSQPVTTGVDAELIERAEARHEVRLPLAVLACQSRLAKEWLDELHWSIYSVAPCFLRN